jgi:hypothetical protein
VRGDVRGGRVGRNVVVSDCLDEDRGERGGREGRHCRGREGCGDGAGVVIRTYPLIDIVIAKWSAKTGFFEIGFTKSEIPKE